MSEEKKPMRQPASFDAAIPATKLATNSVATREPRRPGSFDDARLTPEDEDIFISGDEDSIRADAQAPASSLFNPWRILIAAISLLASMALGLWTDALIRGLFSRSDWLGWTAVGLLALAGLALLLVILKEIWGLRELSTAQALKQEAEQAVDHRDGKAALRLAERLAERFADRPETARGRQVLALAKDDVIDARERLRLAEEALLGPLDDRARQAILHAAKRVSIVTTVSPRAIVDLAYVLYEAVRLVRSIATVYGHRPTTLGLFSLFRKVLTHLAVTGSIAVGDGLVQQILGHGVAARLSARLGEGVINGLMTARIGIAAMDYCRPLPFDALKRPGITDFIADLTPGTTKT